MQWESSVRGASAPMLTLALLLISPGSSASAMAVADARFPTADLGVEAFPSGTSLFPSLFFDASNPGRCADKVRIWIQEHASGSDVSCIYGDFFRGGVLSPAKALMSAGHGLHPYIAFDDRQRPILRVAVILPSADPANLSELRITADQDSRAIRIDSRTRVLKVLSPDSQSVILGLPKDVLPRDFLERVASAEQRVINYGRAGKQKLKISRPNVRSIRGMLELFDALLHDSGQPGIGAGKDPEENPTNRR